MYTSDSMFKRVHAMLQAKWQRRGLHMRLAGQQVQDKAELADDELYGEVFDACGALYKVQKGVLQRGADGAALDPQAGSMQSTFTRDQLVGMMDAALAAGTEASIEDMGMMLLMCCTAGRGDDCRERRICELMPPMLRTCIGEHAVVCCWEVCSSMRAQCSLLPNYEPWI